MPDDAAPAAPRIRRRRRRPGAKRAFLGVTGTAHPRARYDEGKRTEALRKHYAGVPAARIARDLGCHRLTVARWIKEAENLL